ncbi:hypothetical protein DFH29DRAFT_1005436 [Suillus ampliporus]|nr:hypothetical protein DFH29DRAFT_1005436 [Suillus ampliporus]
MSDSSTLSTYEISAFTVWDAANILEYATSWFATIWLVYDKNHVTQTLAYKASFVRHLQWEADCFIFPYLNICMVVNIHSTMPNLLHIIISQFAYFQIRNINAKELHDEFFPHCSPNNKASWLGFGLSVLTIDEVMDMTWNHFEQLPMGAMLVLGPMVTGQADSDALFN